MRPMGAGLAVLLAACSPASDASGPTPSGTQPRQADGAPHRADRPTIVSLNPCTDAILAEVAAPGQLLAISHYSANPRSSSMPADVARRFRTTGGSAEEVLALAPDIVVASSFLAPATRVAFQDLGMRVVTFGAAATVEESERQVRDLAALAGNPAAGAALVGRMEAALAAARPDDDETISAVLWQPGGIVPGEAALVSDLLHRTGFASFSALRGMAQADYLPLELVAADPPDVLLIAGSEVGQRHPILRHLPQVRRAAFDTRLIYCGGPTIIRAARRLAQIRQAYRAGRQVRTPFGIVPPNQAARDEPPNSSHQRTPGSDKSDNRRNTI